MGTITIRFVGLCVHLGKRQAPGIDLAHRVVMLANPKPESIRGKLIEPHLPMLDFPSPRNIDIPGVAESTGPRRVALHAVLITVFNPAGPRFHRDRSWSIVPRLTPPGQPPPALDEGVAYHRKAPAAVYFDTSHGTLFACELPKGAISTSIIIETKGKPELMLASFHGDELHRVRFRSNDVQVTLHNTAPLHKDDKHDFLLSYRIAKRIPRDPVEPKKLKRPAPQCGYRRLGSDLGPSCSNSGYP